MTDTKPKAISEESARAELNKFLEYYGLDIDEVILESDEQSEQRNRKRTIGRIIKAIREERLQVIDEGGVIKLSQKLKNKSELVYGELSGRAKVAMKNCGETDYHGRMYALCGALTGIGDAGVHKIKGQDLSLLECIGNIFLAI